jgi:hypothetical protein
MTILNTGLSCRISWSSENLYMKNNYIFIRKESLGVILFRNVDFQTMCPACILYYVQAEKSWWILSCLLHNFYTSSPWFMCFLIHVSVVLIERRRNEICKLWNRIIISYLRGHVRFHVGLVLKVYFRITFYWNSISM